VLGGGGGDVVDEVGAVGVGELLGLGVRDFGQDQGGEGGGLGGGGGGVFGQDCVVVCDAGAVCGMLGVELGESRQAY